MADVHERPLLRGVSHQIAFFCALAGGVALFALTGGRWAIAVYALSQATMLGVSAAYHRGRWRPAIRRRWQRADHAAIFVFIAGTYTPLCVLALGDATGSRLLAVVWIGAALGVLRAVCWPGAPRWVVSGLYVALGWAMVIALPAVARSIGLPLLALVLLGGIFYTVGATIYALRWPDPWPRVFGYHEVFHALTIAAVVCHFTAIIAITGMTHRLPLGAIATPVTLSASAGPPPAHR